MCVVVYLLCYLDRSNIGRLHLALFTERNLTKVQGNARTLNADKKHDLLSVTNMTTYQYMLVSVIPIEARLLLTPANHYTQCRVDGVLGCLCHI